MAKLKLVPEELLVESFDTSREGGRASGRGGTVFGAALTLYAPLTCALQWTLPECGYLESATCPGPYPFTGYDDNCRLIDTCPECAPD